MSVIGGAERRAGGCARVTGQQRFIADLRLQGMLHVALVRLDCARARIGAIDAAAAEAAPGVRCVVTAAGLPQPVPRFGPVVHDRPVLAVGETHFHGEPVAAVVAETAEAAHQAATLVRVEHEELPAVLTVQQALDAASPLVQSPELRDGQLADTNIFRERRFGWGDVDGARAHLVVDAVYTFPMVTHFAIEPHGFIAAPEQDGIAVWSPTQNPFQMQRAIAALVRLPLSRVRVVAPDSGGAFGGKQHPKYEPLVALLALRTGRPVRLVLSLDETFQEVRRTSCRIHARTGFHADGRVAFADIESDFLMGAYVDIADRVIDKSNYLACGPYRVPAARVVARSLLSHTTPSTAFRGFGTPQVAWAHESQMDEAARRLGVDRLDIRLRNLPRRGEEFIPGDTPCDGDWAQAVGDAAKAVGWGTPLPPGRGRGIAVAVKASATTGASYAVVRLHWDGSATVLAGTSDMGQGARTVLAQIAAHELGVAPAAVNVVLGDTAAVPFDLQTSASRSTVFMGQAVLRACHEVKAQLARVASEVHGVREEDVGVESGVVRTPGGTVAVADLLHTRFGKVRGELIGTGSMRAEHVPAHPLEGNPAFFEFGCTASEVEVDRETGETRLLRHVTAADVGTAINPQHVRMQDEGAAVMGLGHTLMEHILLDSSGRIRNLGALDYRIPTTKDMPATMTALLVENHDGPGPYGAKGAGESGVMSTAPAIAAAITEATGVVIRDLPMTPERVWRALQESAVQPVAAAEP